MQKAIDLVGSIILINIVLVHSAFAGPPVPSVEVINQDPIPVVGTVELVPPAQGGSTEVAVTEVPSEVIDLLSEISEKLDDLRPAAGVAHHKLIFGGQPPLGFLDELVIDLGPTGAEIGSITVDALADKDLVIEARLDVGEPIWRISSEGFPQDARSHFTFPIPFVADYVRLWCSDSAGCGFPRLSVVARPLPD